MPNRQCHVLNVGGKTQPVQAMEAIAGNKIIQVNAEREKTEGPGPQL